MKTVAIENDAKIDAFVVINSTASPDVMWKNIKNVGALSNNDESNPLAQKHLSKTNSPFGAIQWNIEARGPFVPCSKIDKIGATVRRVSLLY